MSHSKAKSQINLEIEQINELLEKYKELLDNVKIKDPDLVEITAIASILHSFYNGIENMFLIVAKYIDREVPDGIHWHKDLLLNMAKTHNNRDIVVSEEVKSDLAEYLAFRHYYRHSYSFHLEWNELKSLALSLTKKWSSTKREIQKFLHQIDNNNL